MITGAAQDRIVKAERGDYWKTVRLAHCIVVGGPERTLMGMEDVSFSNCVFLYDGMEVAGEEWLDFMTQRSRVARN
jgi:hypothetical protein